MTRFAANLTMLFPELPLRERFGAARTAGFDAVEVLFPYDDAVPEMVDMLGHNNLALVLMNCPPPNYTGGARGFAAVPGGQARFQQDFRRALRYAKALKAKHIHVMAGVAQGAQAREVFCANMRWAADQAPDQSLTIEPQNTKDIPGYFLRDAYQAHEILTELNLPNVGLQFDAYHVARIHGDIIPVWEAVCDRVVHVQIAQSPDRTEPEGFGAFLDRLNRDGYVGWVGAEYTPKGLTDSGLGWMVP